MICSTCTFSSIVLTSISADPPRTRTACTSTRLPGFSSASTPAESLTCSDAARIPAGTPIDAPADPSTYRVLFLFLACLLLAAVALYARSADLRSPHPPGEMPAVAGRASRREVA